MSQVKVSLPELIELINHGGNWDRYIEFVYSIFENDFVKSKPIFNGQPLRLKSYPIVDGKAYTFYHMTHKGSDEQNREPDLRRCERIGWARPIIENKDEWNLKAWPQIRNGKNRLCIWLERLNEPDYFVILEIRENYILPWTTFVAEYNNQKVKKLNEYNEYLKKQKPHS